MHRSHWAGGDFLPSMGHSSVNLINEQGDSFPNCLLKSLGFNLYHVIVSRGHGKKLVGSTRVCANRSIERDPSKSMRNNRLPVNWLSSFPSTGGSTPSARIPDIVSCIPPCNYLLRA